MTIGMTGVLPGQAGLGGFANGSISQYMEDGSIFGTPYTGMGFYPGGIINPAANDQYHDMMVHGSDNMTDVQFVNRGNQHALNSYGEIMQKNLPEVAEALRNGEYGKAARLYDEVFEAVSRNYGREITNHQDRLNFEQSIKATISRAYQAINGTTIGMDARQSDEGYLENGFMQGLTLGNHHKATSEEIEAYMTGVKVEGYSSKKFLKGVGKVAGTTLSVGGAAAAGAAIGSIVPGIGTVTGAIIGGGIALLGSLFSNGNDATEVTEA